MKFNMEAAHASTVSSPRCLSCAVEIVGVLHECSDGMNFGRNIVWKLHMQIQCLLRDAWFAQWNSLEYIEWFFSVALVFCESNNTKLHCMCVCWNCVCCWLWIIKSLETKNEINTRILKRRLFAFKFGLKAVVFIIISDCAWFCRSLAQVYWDITNHLLVNNHLPCRVIGE